MRKIGINVISMLPWVWGKRGLKTAVNISRDLGYSGLQVIPLRGWDTQKEYSNHVISVEDPWNTGSFIEGFLRALKVLDHPHNTLLDWVLFGRNPKYLYYPTALKVTRYPNLPGVFEFNKSTYKGIEAHVSRGGTICWDTFHAGNISDWEELYVKYSSHISLVHIHLAKKDIPEFLGGIYLDVAKMIVRLNTLPKDIPFIVEIAPPDPRETFDVLEKMIKVLRLYGV